ncbi:hypothetical protein [Nocardioides sambongensis]|uniref:hypothetical protein n=1 Tax=Nocardioides sambongensis TaxID=2589074 RepID=UPI001128EEA8|nr:hypothetical protein [Nocardioides sambongensis]
MSQPAPVAAPPAAASAPPAGAGASAAPAPEPAYVDTPALLNRWQLIGMSVAIVFGLLSALIQFTSWQSDGRAADDAEQLTRVQEIQSSLLHADALATTSFLAAGIVDTGDQQQAYEEAIDDVLDQIVDAAEAQPADREALAALNQQVNDYDAAVAVGRAYNRQGYPVGAEYLSGASEQLRDEARPILTNLVDANTERAENALGGQHPWWLLAVGLLALAGLFWVNQQIARTFRRRINKGLAIAGAVVLVTTLVAALAAFVAAGGNGDLRDGELTRATDQATARTAANDAKVYENLRLIKRGSGDTYEDPWKEAAAVVEQRSDDDLLGDWETYTERHGQIVERDEDDLWRAAVRIAVDPGATGSTAPLEAFDTSSQELVDELTGTVVDDLRAGRSFALAGSLITLLLGVAAAIAVARGVGERRKEYA